jgi:hypothetical protein
MKLKELILKYGHIKLVAYIAWLSIIACAVFIIAIII